MKSAGPAVLPPHVTLRRRLSSSGGYVAPLLFALWGCTGTIDNGPGNSATGGNGPGGNPNAGAGNGAPQAGAAGGGMAEPGDLPPVENCPAGVTADPGPAISRRLTRTEYDNTVKDLLTTNATPAREGFPQEELAYNFDNNPSVLTVSPVLAEAYFTAAEALAAEAVQTRLTSLAPCAGSGTRACGEEFLKSFGARAFRRPLEADEITRFMKVFDVGAQTDFASGVRLVITALLQAAPFLYRLEFGSGQAGTTSYVKPTSYEMASRLSYLFWKSMPDTRLFEVAAQNGLQTPEQIAKEAATLAESPRVRATVVDFHEQWLDFRKIPTLQKEATIFTGFSEDIAAEMRTEAVRFVEDILFSGSGNASALYTSNSTFLSPGLARFYGVTAPSGSDFQKVTLDASQRAGILTLGGVLSLHAKQNQTSPVLRGKFVREQILCDHVQPPPGDVDTQVPDLDPNLTTRERFRQHSEDGTCAGCHSLMDPIGLAFENFDGVGRYRAAENGISVDASGEIYGTDVAGTFRGAAELGQKLAQSNQAKRCMVLNWYRYATARTETSGDKCTVDAVTLRFAESGYNVKQLMLALTQTDAFLYRRSNGGAQ